MNKPNVHNLQKNHFEAKKIGKCNGKPRHIILIQKWRLWLGFYETEEPSPAKIKC
jgi:hypothetical protein